jgi:hypothetical protein
MTDTVGLPREWLCSKPYHTTQSEENGIVAAERSSLIPNKDVSTSQLGRVQDRLLRDIAMKREPLGSHPGGDTNIHRHRRVEVAKTCRAVTWATVKWLHPRHCETIISVSNKRQS